MKKIIILLTILSCSPSLAGYPQTTSWRSQSINRTSKPSYGGGIGNYSAPVTRSLPSPAFKGGQYYYNGGKYLGSSRPNNFGGTNYYNSRGNLTQRSLPSAIKGGYNFHNFSK